MGIRNAVVLFADIIGCSEVSNNCGVEEYDEFIKQYHKICSATRDLFFSIYDYSVEEMESMIRGDEICLVLHSGHDINGDTAAEDQKHSIVKDVRNALGFAFGLKLMWLISDYNKKRMQHSLLPRDIGVGINIGPVMFSIHPATARDKSSEGYTINLAKRIEGVSRRGIYSKVFICKEFKYICEHNNILLEFGNGLLYELPGITTPPYLHEIKYLVNEKIITTSPIMQELSSVSRADIDLYLGIAKIHAEEFWLRTLVKFILLASNDKRAIDLLKEADFISEAEKINILLQHGNVHYHLSDFDSAITHYQKIIDLDNKYAHALYNLGLSYFSKGEFELALDNFCKVFDILPPADAPYLEIGATYREMGDYTKALEYLQRALKINPQDVEFFIEIGATYREIGDFTRALENLRLALDKAPNNYEVYGEIGTTYREMGDYDKALENLQRALQVNPNSWELYEQIYMTYREMGDYDKALEYVRKGLVANPKSDKPYVSMCIIYMDKGDLEKALQSVDQALDVNSQSAFAYYHKACIFCLKGDVEQTYGFLETAIMLDKRYKKLAINDTDFKSIAKESRFDLLTK